MRTPSERRFHSSKLRWRRRRAARIAERRARELEAAKAAASAALAAIPEQAPPGTPPHDDSGEETPMYFVEPTQLPAVFSRLEETNLFLMQNGQ